MADADEDQIPRSTAFTHEADPSYDLEDETQDFRFLASLTPNSNGILPKRGEKDFEPNPTQSQASTLHASREAMHNALAVERLHLPRNPNVGQYLPHEEDWRDDIASDTYGSGSRCVVVEKYRGTHTRTLGKEDWRGWTWFLPEEALFLLERGSLDIRYPDGGVEMLSKSQKRDDRGSGGDVPHDDTYTDPNGSTEKLLQRSERIEGEGTKPNTDDAKSVPVQASLRTGEVPMSLQGAYASLINKSGLTLERYSVYSGLKRLGYIVQRAPTWSSNDDNLKDSEEIEDHNTNGDADRQLSRLAPPSETSSPTIWSATALINRLVSWLFTPQPRQYNPSLGPLLAPGLYRNYNDIFRVLSLIPSSSQHHSSYSSKPKPPFTIHYHVWKPTPQFRKSHPPPPDFRISVLDARDTSVPTLSQISALLDTMPEDSLPGDRKMEIRLKHGRRNVILAVVDCGIVSYLRVADCRFDVDGRVFEEKVRRGGGKGGGRGRGGGSRGRGGGGSRGRGRGRGG